MDISAFKTFLVLSETKNFTAAGKRLHIVQSTVSNRIRDLENYYERQLFTRENKTVELTASGRQLLPYIKRLVEMEKEAYTQMQQMKIETVVNIGSYQLAYHCYLRDYILGNFSNQQYNIKIEHSWELDHYLDDHLIDVAYTSYYDRRDKYHLIRQIEEPIIHVKVPDYEGSDIVYAPISNAFIEWFDLHFSSNRKVMSIDQSVETIEYILKGVGSGFLPQSVVEKYLLANKLVAIESSLEPYQHTTYIVCRSKDAQKYGKDYLMKGYI
jgi:DNA-binding transcriptional LysR family regulator